MAETTALGERVPAAATADLVPLHITWISATKEPLPIDPAHCEVRSYDRTREVTDVAIFKGTPATVRLHRLRDIYVLYFGGPKRAWQDGPELGRRGVALFDRDGAILDRSTMIGTRERLAALAADALPLGDIFFAGDRFTDGNICHMLFDHVCRAHEVSRTRLGSLPVALYATAWPWLDEPRRQILGEPVLLREGIAYHADTLTLAGNAFDHPMHHPSVQHSAPFRDALRGVRDKLCFPSRFFPRRIYVDRRSVPFRKIRNENALIQALKALNFRAIDLAELSPRDQLMAVYNAEAIVAPHGAGLTNLIAARKGLKLLELFPDKCTDAYERFAKGYGVEHHRFDMAGTRVYDVPAIVAAVEAMLGRNEGAAN